MQAYKQGEKGREISAGLESKNTKTDGKVKGKRNTTLTHIAICIKATNTSSHKLLQSTFISEIDILKLNTKRGEGNDQLWHHWLSHCAPPSPDQKAKAHHLVAARNALCLNFYSS